MVNFTGMLLADRTPHASRKIGAPRGGFFVQKRRGDPIMTQQAEPTSVADQIQFLSAQGMAFSNTGQAKRALNHIGFHRLSSYWQPFESLSGTGSGTMFQKGTSFNAVVARYLFDQRLRSLLLEAFSFIEISVRTHWADQLAYGFQHGDFAHQKTTLFDQQYHKGNLQELGRTYKQSQSRINNFQTLTIWDVLPAMSFGQLSKWYSSLTDRTIRQSISQIYGMDERTLVSSLRHLTKVRNICAHHERLWDRRISTGLRLPKRLGNSTEAAAAFNRSDKDQGKIYNSLVNTVHLMEIITPNGDWPQRFVSLGKEENFDSIPYKAMGFPSEWEDYAIWQRHLPQ